MATMNASLSEARQKLENQPMWTKDEVDSVKRHVLPLLEAVDERRIMTNRDAPSPVFILAGTGVPCSGPKTAADEFDGELIFRTWVTYIPTR